jgi:hypothetical protein
VPLWWDWELREPAIDADALILLIRAKLASGRLPKDSIPRVWAGPGDGEMCYACNKTATKPEYVVEGPGGQFFHIRCFHLWDAERQAPQPPKPARPA